MGVKDNFIYEECMKELDATFGERQQEHLSLHGLEPGTEEYKRVETILIKRICEIDLEDETRFD